MSTHLPGFQSFFSFFSSFCIGKISNKQHKVKFCEISMADFFVCKLSVRDHTLYVLFVYSGECMSYFIRLLGICPSYSLFISCPPLCLVTFG